MEALVPATRKRMTSRLTTGGRSAAVLVANNSALVKCVGLVNYARVAPMYRVRRNIIISGLGGRKFIRRVVSGSNKFKAGSMLMGVTSGVLGRGWAGLGGFGEEEGA